MAENTRPSKLKLWTSLSRFEQVTLAGTILVWIGVFLFGVGLYVALANFKMERDSFVQATAIALADTTTVTPSPTPITFPVGWSTATPTAAPTATLTPVAVQSMAMWSSMTPLPEEPSMLVVTPVAVTRTPRPTAIPLATSAASAPRPTQTPTSLPPASQPPDRLVIKSINLDSPILPVGWHQVQQGGVQYSVWDVADDAVSWHKTSAYPGHNSNIVLSGHNNIKGEIFRYLIDVQVGDRLLLYASGYAYHYRVTEKHLLKERGEPLEVRRENAKWIAPTEEEQLTLVTCWPYTGNSHRLVVVAKPAAPLDPGQLEK